MKIFYKAVSVIMTLAMLTGVININAFAASAGGIKIDGNTYFEAEDCSTMNAPMTVYKDSTAFGNAYAAATVGSQAMTSPQRDYAHLIYKMTVPEDRGYFVWMRVRTTATAKYYMCFDDGVYKKQVSLNKVAENPGEWMWVCADKYWLKAGEHELKIRYCTVALQYDAFYITSDYTFVPEGANPEISFDMYERDENGNITNLKYNLSSYLPPDEHPRLLFRKSDIERIKSNLTHEQNIDAYNNLLKNAEHSTDGKMAEIKYGDASNMNTNVSLKIEANALLYQLTGDESYGYKAIEVSKNYMESAMVDATNDSSTGRTMMWGIWSASLCYDWCYDLLTEEDKNFLIYYMLFNTRFSEVSYPPVKYGVYTGNSEINGHILEFQMLGAMMALGVAAYDEIPDYYNMIAGRIEQYIVPAANVFNQSAMYSEGSNYGMYRHYYEVLNNYIYKAMGYDNVYDEEGLSALGYMYIRQPDGEMFGVGDDYNNYKNGYSNDYNAYTYFLLGNMLGNAYFKTEYWRTNMNEVKTSTVPGHITPAMWLIINDVDVPCDKSFRNFPLTTYTGDDSGYMFARTNWDEGYDSSAAMCLMNLKTHYIGGHEHKDVGHFSLYYKGLLALDSGIYQGKAFTDSKGKSVTSVGWGNTEHRAYAIQSIAHNTVLVYDPNEQLSAYDSPYFSTIDGGQKWSAGQLIVKTLDGYYDEGKAADVLGYNWGPDLREPVYSYMKGDLTNAYTDKVENFQRSFMFFNFKDDTYPAALIVFDSVRSASPTFKKTWLLHSEEEPVIDGNSVTITRDTIDYDGRLINQTLMPDNGFAINKIGQDYDGVSKYLVGDTLYEMKPQSDTAEAGNWRIEISPTSAEKQSYFLNVLQLSDNDDSIAPLESKLVENTDEYVGVEINGHVAYFRKDGLSKKKDFSIHPGDSDEERFFAVTGVGEGIWTVYDEDGNIVAEETVYDGHDSLSFSASGANFKLKFKSAVKLEAPDYSVFGLAVDDKKSIDVCIDKCYQTFENEWYEYEGTVFAPIAEVLEKFEADENCTSDFSSVRVDNGFIKHEFVYGKEGVTRFNGVLYAPIELIKDLFNCNITYDSIASIVQITYGNRTRDRIQIYDDPDPSVAKILRAYTEGETSSTVMKSLDGDTSTYGCTIGDASFIMVMKEPTEISKIGLFWLRGTERQEIFDMYVSEDLENWTQVFSGMSDGKTNGFEYIPVGDGKKYKYVRIDCHGNTSNTYNSLAEFKVYK